jgi:hypothetical protein
MKVEGQQVAVKTRNGHDAGPWFPELVRGLAGSRAAGTF